MSDLNKQSNIEKEDKRKKIIEAALRAYVEYGLSKATTRQIAEFAGIGKSTIYEYFTTKEELMSAAFDSLIYSSSESRIMIHNLAKDKPFDALNFYIENTIQLALSNPGVLFLLSQYMLEAVIKSSKYIEAKEQYEERINPIFYGLMDEFKFIIENGIKFGVFKPAISTKVQNLVYVVGALIREIQAQAFIQEKDELSKMCADIKQTIFDILGVPDNLRG